MTDKYSVKRFYSVAAIPEGDWSDAQNGSVDLEMSLPFLRAVEQSMPEAKLSALIVYLREEPVAAAVVSAMTTDILLLAGKHIQRWASWVRQAFPGFLVVRMTVCGLPPTTGGSALRIVAGGENKKILSCIHSALVAHAKEFRSQLVVLKEFAPEYSEQLAPLGGLGYQRADSLPDNYFDMRFGSFKECIDGLRSRYRNQLKRSLKRFSESGLRIVQVQDHLEAERIYTDQVHSLYEQVLGRATSVMERLPAKFFRTLCREASENVHFTFAYKENVVVGFVCGVLYENKYYNLFCGFDYVENESSALYYNLMVENISYALDIGANSIHVGSTADTFKERLGCFQVPLDFYFYGTSWWFFLVRPLHGYLFPPCPLAERRHIFSDTSEPLRERANKRLEAPLVSGAQ